MRAHQDTHEDGDGEAYVPLGVVKAIDDLEEGRTMTDEDFDDALKF